MSYNTWLLLSFLIFSANDSGNTTLHDIDYIIEPLELNIIPGDEITIVDFSGLKLLNKKLDFVLSGNFSHKAAMDNTFVRRLDTFYSSKGYNKFERLPFRINETPMCKFYNTSWRFYFEPLFIGKTNFPAWPPEVLCPIPKGDFWVKDILLNADHWPTGMPRGIWRIEDRYYRTQPNRQLIGGLVLYVRLLDKQD